jgi:hypothetical protein
MIEKIEFLVEGHKNSKNFNKVEFLFNLKKDKYNFMYSIYAIKSWIFSGNKIVSNYGGNFPSYNWDCIINRIDSNELIIVNPDDSIRFSISVPSELIQWEDYEKHFGLKKHFKRNEYKMVFERINDYFEFENKFYSIIIVSLVHENEPFDAYVQERYLDTDTGLFLPFTKRISRRTPNQYDYNEETVKLD